MKENIEEDIEILEHIKMGIKADTQAPNVSIRNVAIRKFEAIEHILSDYQRLQEEFKQVDHECERLEQKELRLEKEVELAKEVLKKQCDIADERNQLLIENQKLQKENEELKDKYDVFVKMSSEVIKNSVPVQKIKDKIEYIEKEGYWLFLTDRDSDKCVEILQNLLEEKGE